jgi:hypothetical protein
MSPVTLYRASGLALLLGLALIIISTGLSFAFQFMTPQWWVVTLGWNIGSLLLLGLPGICARQALRAGWLGFAGFLLTFISVFLTASFFFVYTLLILPWLAQVAPKLAGSFPPALFLFTLVAGILFALGGILLGSAIMRAGVLPPLSGLLLLSGASLTLLTLIPVYGRIISLIVGTLVFVLFAVALGLIGYALMSTRSVDTAQPATASS